MDSKEFLERLNNREAVKLGSEMHKLMCELSNEAMRITSELNGVYYEADEVRALFSKLIGKQVDSSFFMFPPFYTDCGKNISLGKNVFINSGCHFQDQGGITIGDGSQIGHKVTLTTLNHGITPEDRHTLYPAPISIGRNVWIGAGVILVPGVSIGDNAVVGAGSVVTKDVPGNSVVVGVPGRVIRGGEEGGIL